MRAFVCARVWMCASCVCVFFCSANANQSKSHFAVILELEADDGQTCVFLGSCSRLVRYVHDLYKRLDCEQSKRFSDLIFSWMNHISCSSRWMRRRRRRRQRQRQRWRWWRRPRRRRLHACLALKLTLHKYTRWWDEETEAKTKLKIQFLASCWLTHWQNWNGSCIRRFRYMVCRHQMYVRVCFSYEWIFEARVRHFVVRPSNDCSSFPPLSHSLTSSFLLLFPRSKGKQRRASDRSNWRKCNRRK